MANKSILALPVLIFWAGFSQAQQEPAWSADQYICGAVSPKGDKIQITQALAGGEVLNYTADVKLPPNSFDANLAIGYFINKYCVAGTVIVNGAWCCKKN